MKLRALVVFFWGCLIAAAAVAGEEQRTEIKIAIDGEDTGHRVFHFDSQDSGFDLHEMAVGESKVITDSDGNDVTVMRTEKGFEFDVDGEKIEIAGLHGDHDIEDISIEKNKQVRMIKTRGRDGVTIISGDEIDEATRGALKEVLEKAGKNGDVIFIDGTDMKDGAQVHEVRVIKKEIEVTN